MEHLSLFITHARSSKSYDYLLFITILSCCFYGCHCSGELVQSNDKSLFDWRKIIKQSSLSFYGDRAQYCLPYHKGDPFYHGTDVLFLPQDITNPVTLLTEYIGLRDKLHGAAASLSIREDGSQPSRSWFNSLFFSILNHSFGGHSTRAGGATFYASLGLSEDIIQALGRWSSTAWKIKTPSSLLYVAFIFSHHHLPPHTHINSLSYSFFSAPSLSIYLWEST